MEVLFTATCLWEQSLTSRGVGVGKVLLIHCCRDICKDAPGLHWGKSVRLTETSLICEAMGFHVAGDTNNECDEYG